MSFDMKYNRDGMPIRSADTRNALDKAAAAVEVAPTPAPVVEIQTQSAPEVVEAQEETNVDVVVPSEEVVEEVVAEPAKENSAAKNFRAVRERAERAERERDDYFRLLQQQELSKIKVQAPQEDEDLSFNVDADALVEGKHLSKVDRKIQNLERKLAQYEQRSTETNAETRLKSQYSDFDSVVTPDNIATLKEDYPELAQAIIATPDLYAKGKTAYMLLKKFGIAADPVVVAEKALVQKNAAKPRPLASVAPQQGQSPMSQANAFANGLTKELSEQLNREMYEARRNM